MQDFEGTQGGDGMEADQGLAVLLAAEQLAGAMADSILASSSDLDRAALKRDAAQVIWRAVSRFTRDDDDEDAVLLDAVADMDEWLDRLPVGSGWAVAFGKSQGYILDALE